MWRYGDRHRPLGRRAQASGRGGPARRLVDQPRRGDRHGQHGTPPHRDRCRRSLDARARARRRGGDLLRAWRVGLQLAGRRDLRGLGGRLPGAPSQSRGPHAGGRARGHGRPRLQQSAPERGRVPAPGERGLARPHLGACRGRGPSLQARGVGGRTRVAPTESRSPASHRRARRRRPRIRRTARTDSPSGIWPPPPARAPSDCGTSPSTRASPRTRRTAIRPRRRSSSSSRAPDR